MSVDRDQALSFVTMLNSGMPSMEAIRYFLPPDLSDLPAIRRIHDSWMRDRTVLAAQAELMGNKTWMALSLDEKIRWALEKHYAEHAYFLYSHNYAELEGPTRQKADTCRQVLETKLAGMSGKLDALTAFYADVTSGKLKLPGSNQTVGSQHAKLAH